MIARALRRLAAVRLLRPVLEIGPVEYVAATLIRSRIVQASGAFALRELLRRRGIRRYRLRDEPATVFIRHATGDVVTLDEVFLQRHYESPETIDRTVSALGRAPSIVDLGANIGLSAAFFFLRYPGARVIAVEPDEANLALLRRCIDENGWGDDCNVIAAAAGTAHGHVAFRGGEVALSRLAATGERSEQVPAIDVLPLLRRADLVKMDIEGGEWAILSDQRFAGAAQVIVLEYHPYLCPDPDPHRAVAALLEGSGYHSRPIFRRQDGHGMLWAARKP